MSAASGNGGVPDEPPSAQQSHAKPAEPSWVDLCDPKTWREFWLAQLGHFAEEQMRSPVFLAWVRYFIELDNARLRLLDSLHAPTQHPIPEEKSSYDH